jgi:hypothetical protein
MMARGLAKSSFRTPRTQRRELRVDRFGPERTQKNEVLSRKTGRQAKFGWTLDQFLFLTRRVMQQNLLYCTSYCNKFLLFCSAGWRG